MLRATARALRERGRTAFITIELAPDLQPQERQRAREAGPRAVTANRPYPHLLERTGFAHVHVDDVTEAYLATLKRWVEQTRSHWEKLIEVDGREAVHDRLDSWTAAIEAVEAGWLRRTIYSARRHNSNRPQMGSS
ncbi:MAG: hypothetical protein M3O70_23975 [Actinomycetota bacterium]|nr:hypothetical protein [Actinomycetota bacterium]